MEKGGSAGMLTCAFRLVSGLFSRAEYKAVASVHLLLPAITSIRFVSDSLIECPDFRIRNLLVSSLILPIKMSGCGNDKCTCGSSCTGCSCKKNMDDSMLASGIECDSDGCSCSSCSNCAPSCGCTSCSSSH